MTAFNTLLRTICLVLLAGTASAATPPAVADFFDHPAFRGAALSPSGRYLAAVTTPPGGRARLAVVDLASFQATVVAQFTDVDVGKFDWVNDERLLFDTNDSTVAQRDVSAGPGLFAVNRDGSKFRQLAKRNDPVLQYGNDNLLPWHTFMLDQAGAQDSVSVLVEDRTIVSPGIVIDRHLMRLDTTNGRNQTLPLPPHLASWWLDHQGQPRLVSTTQDSIGTLHFLDPASGTWRVLASHDIYSGGAHSFSPLGFSPDGSLYVLAQMGQDTESLYRFDLATNKVAGKPLVELKGFDFRGDLISSRDKLLGVRVHADAEGTVWFDDGMKALQAKVDALLPTTVNLLTLPVRAETPWVLVASFSDHQPRKFLVFNTASEKLSEVGGQAPRIRPADMANNDLVNYPARDGLPIPAWLTRPNGGGKKLPLVLLVHGGPFVRGSDWRWHPEAQFLASRGYAVLEPEFRGSVGFGEAHFRAGWKQWGLKMQDDLADGVRWAVAQGIAAPRRVCIAGGSYGGYATLMGLVNDPDLYRCGIDWAGVTDIGLLYNSGWGNNSDLPASWKAFGMPQLVGDPVQDAAQLEATSPLKQAARIHRPLLLAYGGADVRVPIVHGNKFMQAVKSGNPDVEWIEYPEEGHGWYLPKNRIDFWTRVEKFLDKHIGKP